MSTFVQQSAYFGVVISLLAYFFGMWLRRVTKKSFLNPLLIAIVLVMAFLAIFRIDYADYKSSAKSLSYMLTPATVCLAIPLYEQIRLLKQNLRAVLLGILSGVLTSLTTVLLLSILFGLTRAEIVTLLPKSITTAIGMPLAEMMGGYPSIAAAVIIVTGIMGNLCASGFLRLLRVNDPIAVGAAIGTSSHAIGTTRALEIGKVEGAASSLAIVVAGLMTVLLVQLYTILPMGA